MAATLNRQLDYTMAEPPLKKNFLGVNFRNPYDSEDDDLFQFEANSQSTATNKALRAFSDSSMEFLSVASPTLTTNMNDFEEPELKYSPSITSESDKEDDEAAGDEDGYVVKSTKMSKKRVRSSIEEDGQIKIEGHDSDDLGEDEYDILDDDKSDDKSKLVRSSSSASTTGATTKKRTRATPEQLAILEETFLTNTSPNSKMREQLAEKVNMSERSIQIWFQNRRAKVKTIQKRAHMLQEEAMKAQYMAAMGGMHHGNLYPFRSPFPQHMPGRIPLPRSASFETLHSLPNQMRGNSLNVNMSQPFWPQNQPGYGDMPMSMPQQQFLSAQPIPIPGQMQAQYIPPGAPFPPAFSPNGSPNFRIVSPGVGNLVSSNPISTMPTQVSNAAEQANNASNPSLAPSIVPGSKAFSVDTLSIGSWRRMVISMTDLLCYYNIPEKQMSWHISDNNSHFKMEFSFEAIQNLEYVLLEDGMSAKVHMELSECPLFYMESKDGGPNGKLVWTQCSDFTEGKQASKNFKHTLKGRAQTLKQQIVEITSADARMQKLTTILDQPTYHGPHSFPGVNMMNPNLMQQYGVQRRRSYNDAPLPYPPAAVPVVDGMNREPQKTLTIVQHQNMPRGRPRRSASTPTAPIKVPPPSQDVDKEEPVDGTSPVIMNLTPPTPTDPTHTIGQPPPLSINTSPNFLAARTYRTDYGPHGQSPLSMVNSADDETNPFNDALNAYRSPAQSPFHSGANSPLIAHSPALSVSPALTPTTPLDLWNASSPSATDMISMMAGATVSETDESALIMDPSLLMLNPPSPHPSPVMMGHMQQPTDDSAITNGTTEFTYDDCDYLIYPDGQINNFGGEEM